MPSLKKNFFYSALLTLANYVFPLITYPYVSRVLGVTNIGICNFVDGVVNYFIIFSMMGISVVGVREIAASRGDRLRENRTFSNLLSLNAATSLLAAVALLASIFIFPKLYAHKELMGIGVVRLIFNFLCIEWLFKGLEDFRYITLRSVIIRTLYVIAVFVFVRKPGDYGIYYLLFTLTFLGNALVNLFYSRRYVSFSWKHLSLRALAGPYFLIGLYTIMTSMYTTFNVVFLGFVSTEEQVGFYGSATKIFGMVIALFTAFTTVMLPRMSSVLAEGREDEFRRIVQKVLRVLFCLGIPLILLMEAEATDIIRIISGEGFEGAIVPMQIIAPLILVIGMEQILVLQTMMPKKCDREVLVNSIIGATVGVFLNILLVRRLEAVGSSIVWLLSELVVLAGAIVVVSRRVGIRFPIRSLLLEIGKYLFLIVLLWITSLIPGPFYVRFIIASGVTGLYFLLLNFVLIPNPDIIELWMSVIPAPWLEKFHQ
jgi:O-antigen/teichoic acid export membrane protein